MSQSRKPPSFQPPGQKGKTALIPRILVMCEGKTTEPIYFKHMRTTLRYPAMIIRSANGKTSPEQVIQHAIKYADLDDDAFDYVFCVFDKDDHPSFERALGIIEQANSKRAHKFITIPTFSIPCFEVWMILHFKNTCLPRTAKQAKREIKNLDSGYVKMSDSFLSKLALNLDTAIRSARQIDKSIKSSGQRRERSLPCTNVHILLEMLQTRNKPKNYPK